MKKFLFTAIIMTTLTPQIFANNQTRLVTDRSLELTGFQESRPYNSRYDIRTDFAMVYGSSQSRIDVLKTWTDNDYLPHLMTGISWGPTYRDYNDIYGNNLMALSQIKADGSKMLHNPTVPYMVPTVEFADYLSQKLRPLIDAGILALHLEEPEFWAFTGFSEPFKKEWQIFFNQPYVRPDTSVDAQYKASQLKYYLYSRTIRRVAESCKEYAKLKHNRNLRVYVPTHSLINYTHWQIVSPQSSLIDSDVIDGCIAQIWTGTSRTPNVYQGQTAERTFETAFLEYGIMQELVRNTSRRLWFLHDPIEDNTQLDWNDYTYNYKATLIASLLHPYIHHYEVAPWIHRVLTVKYPRGEQDAKPIPPDYATTLSIVFNQLRDMNQTDIQWENPTHGIGVFIADSAMFQRAEPAFSLCKIKTDDPTKPQRKDIVNFSAFYGLTLPLIKHGIPAQPVQLDNVVRFANYLDNYRILVLSYEFMKPQTPSINLALAEWVSKGGTLVYVGADTDPFNKVSSWWNAGNNDYTAPSQHLFDLMGIDKNAKQGQYNYGKGNVFIERKYPAYYTRSEKAADQYRDVIKKAAKAAKLKYQEQNYLQLRRGPYIIAACLENSISEKPLQLEGLFVDIYDARLPIVEKVTVKPGQRAWLMDMKRIDNNAQPIASAARFETWKQTKDTVEFKLSFAQDIPIASRIKLPQKPKNMIVDGNDFDDYQWDQKTKTIFFKSDSETQQQRVKILW